MYFFFALRIKIVFYLLIYKKLNSKVKGIKSIRYSSIHYFTKIHVKYSTCCIKETSLIYSSKIESTNVAKTFSKYGMDR